MEKYTMIKKGNKLTIQEADYIEDGCYIEIIDDKITLYEIPMFGSVPAIEIGVFKTIIEAMDFSKTLS